MESWASPNGRGEIEEEQESPASAVADRVFVAVGKELKEGKTTLLWTLQNFHRPIVITHVHRPATMIPLMGGKFPVSQLKEQEVRAYRELEREKMNKCIDDFLLLCSQKKVKADKLVVEMDDVSKGLIELIAQYGITKLVMGAAADKHYSKKLKAPRSKTATTVKQLADSSCHIWFVCKGNLICTREVGLPYGLDQSSMNSPSSVSSSISLSSYSEQLRSRSSEGKGGALKHMHNIFWHRPSSENLSLHGAGTMSAMAHPLPIKSSSPLCRRSLEGYFGSDTWEELPKRILQSSYPSSSSENDEVLSNSDFHSLTREGSEVCSVLPVNMSDENLNLSPDYELEDMGVDTELHHKLQDALIEAENFRREVYKESLRHWRAQRGAFENFRREGMGGDAELYHQLQDTRTEAGSFRREVYKESLRVERDAFEAFLRKDLGFDAELHQKLQDFLTKSRNFEREVYKESLGNEKAKRDPFEAFQTEEMSVDAELYHKLQDALSETGNLKREAYEESLRRQRAERDAFEAFQRAKASENMYAKEVKLRKEIEEALERENLELEMIKNQQHELSEELQKMNKEKLELELRITDSVNCIKDLEEKLSTGHHLLSSLQEERDLLQMERDKAVREVKELHQKKEEIPSKIRAYTNLSEFSLSEIEQATHSFSLSLKIGEGGYGTIYKGFLRHTTVAIKMLNRDSMRGRLEFDQEVDLLSRMRHPNLVTLIGACSEAWALIYEYLPNGSLEDSLTCKSNSLPLTWQARTRIAAEICSALIFLHSSKPHAIVHGDLKPENILLDANLVSKLSNFGLCRTIVQSDTTTFYRQTHPKGAFVYMDPMFVATGDLTPCSDVYAFGVIILRLLTGTAALGIVKAVQDAIDKQTLHGIIDPTAGDWPFVQAKQLAHLGLRCCEINRKNRPDLTGEVWRVLEPMMKAASFSTPKISFSLITDDNGSIPSYFMCPILQEVMRDPHIAADGFTYEAEALRGWIHSGHKTSPMTNLKLPHSELIPNRALRSAIQEWMQQQLKQF